MLARPVTDRRAAAISSCLRPCGRRSGRRAWPSARPRAPPACAASSSFSRAMRAASAAAASASRRFCSAFSASRACLGLAALGRERLALGAPRRHRGIVGPGWARNLFKMSFFACCAAFCRSAKPGSLNPLIDVALCLSSLALCLAFGCRAAESWAHAFGSDVQRRAPEATHNRRLPPLISAKCSS